MSTIGMTSAFSGFAVPDTVIAAQFYRDVVGLKVTDQMMGLLRIELPGGAEVVVYPKPDHRPAVFTILNFEVDNIDVAVDELASRGVIFERYDGMEQDAKGIARGGPEQGPSIAWFTDPAGNILSVLHSA